jgi:hypothetical protein
VQFLQIIQGLILPHISGVRDVTVNNYFSGFVNGDEEKIALRIWEIIKRKDALNLT